MPEPIERAGDDTTEYAAHRPLHVRAHPLVALFIWGAAIVIVIRFWSSITSIAMVFLLACAIAAGARPLVRRLPWSRPLSGVLIGIAIALSILGAIVLMAALLYTPVQSELQNWPEAEAQIDQTLADWSARFGIEEPITVDAMLSAAKDWAAGPRAEGAIAQFAGNLAGFIVGFALLLFGQLFLLAQPPGLITAPLARLLPPERRLRMHQAIEDAEFRLRWWIIGTLLSMGIIAAATWLGYTIIGLKFAATLALFGGLAQAVPTLGPTITFIIALIVASSQGTTQMVGVAIVYLTVETIESYILLPIVMRKAVNIPPVVTLFSIVLWANLLGPLGLLLALPIDLVIWSALRHFVIIPRHDRIAQLERLGEADDG